ncbi:kinase-like domain-containing protein [Nemania serpens]|nr:kinase-like domain-containing protein [Nemania serpens]
MHSITNILKNGSRRVRLALGRAQVRTAAQARHVRTFDEEDPSRYFPGGYHPVRIGDEFHNGKYRVIRKLGYGLYSTVWLARNSQTDEHVALKILTADSFGGEKPTFELDILRYLASKATETPGNPGADHIVGLQDEFKHSGPNGRHVCLRKLFPRAKLPIPVAKKVTKELLMALAFLHDTCQVIHTDIKPQNILIETSEINEMFRYAPSELFSPFDPPYDPPTDYYMKSEQVVSGEEEIETADVSIRLADFGTASWVDKHLTEWIQPQMLRAPEVILRASWDHKVDIWNLGLIIWELVQGRLVFDGQATATSAYSSEAHLAQMNAILGTFPNTLLDRSESRHTFFEADGRLISSIHFPPVTLRELCRRFQYPVEQDSEDLLEFVESTLALEPKNRPDARELLNTGWVRDV